MAIGGQLVLACLLLEEPQSALIKNGTNNWMKNV